MSAEKQIVDEYEKNGTRGLGEILYNYEFLSKLPYETLKKMGKMRGIVGRKINKTDLIWKIIEMKRQEQEEPSDDEDQDQSWRWASMNFDDDNETNFDDDDETK